MAKGTKTGGRQKGTPNKRETYSVHQRIRDLGIDLVSSIIDEINSMDRPYDKARCYLQLLEYCDSKRKAIEISEAPRPRPIVIEGKGGERLSLEVKNQIIDNEMEEDDVD